ncbi:uncharacterized protein LOC112340981 [Selaginella moellendorffii]|uniref:uncharacterized protein LOC112340981 n=1 Tax=Selaginella moellendorffii TaxID=88036 RepID=UPI000D1CDBEF|nr:uncharacterized protein LOC112340981 [Selaginella moellendorffii]|eukprot:XP_024516082.1 uncharacterized protein LOC112340981 [Selaginella moellendorffii]
MKSSRRHSQLVWIVLILDAIAFALAVAATLRIHRATAQRDSPQGDVFTCEYRAGQATNLGIAAASFLAAGQLFVTLVTRCMCCPCPLKRKAANICAVILFIFSWIAFLVAELFILTGTARVTFQSKRVSGSSIHECKVARQVIFGIGAAAALLTGLLASAYYLCYVEARKNLRAGEYV